MAKQTKTSFESSSKWYDSAVGEKGHYYHEKVILPRLKEWLSSAKKVLDFGCGQGVLARQLPKECEYVGVDASFSLISAAKKRSKQRNHRFEVADLTKPLSLKERDFTDGVLLLSLQNMEKPGPVLKNMAHHLVKEGKLYIILNHPCFRIPRQTSWGVDEKKKLQYRRIDSYLSDQKIPIQTHPGKKGGETTFSFHSPLSTYIELLFEAGLVVVGMEEWTSDKTSTGGRAKMENRARREIPLFLAITAMKSGAS